MNDVWVSWMSAVINQCGFGGGNHVYTHAPSPSPNTLHHGLDRWVMHVALLCFVAGVSSWKRFSTVSMYVPGAHTPSCPRLHIDVKLAWDWTRNATRVRSEKRQRDIPPRL